MEKLILGIDIGGTNTKLALVDEAGKTGQVVSIPTAGASGVGQYLNDAAEKAKTLISACDAHKVGGVGIGVAGFIDPDHAVMTFNPNIAWLEGVPLANYFMDALELPVSLEIDSNAAALAEAVYGNGKTSKRLLVLSVGTGLGGGMVVDRKILRISNECLGDIGHVIVDKNGVKCSSGCTGCAEAMVSVSALERYAREYMAEDESSFGYEKAKHGIPITVPEIIHAVHENDKAAKKAIRKMGNYLGTAIASMAPIFAPDTICIAGGISEAGKEFINAIQSSFKEVSGTPYSKDVVVQKALLGWQSVLVGAAEVCRSTNFGSA